MSATGQERGGHRRSAVDRHGMIKAEPIATWRWIALIALIAWIAQDRLHPHVDGPASALAPPTWTIAAWIAIQILLLCHGAAQLFESQRHVVVYDRVSRLVALIAALMSVRLAMPWANAALAVAIAGATAVAYLRVRQEIAASRASSWVSLPFSMLLGWSSFAAIAALDATLASSATATVMLAIVAGGAMFLGLHFRDFVVPGLVAWLATSICETDWLPASVATGALIAGGLCATVAIVIAATRLSRAPRAALPSPSRRSRRA